MSNTYEARFPNIRKTLETAFISGSNEKIEDAILYVINGIVAQCPNEDGYGDASDIEDLPVQPKFKNCSMPETFAQAYEMLSYGYLTLIGGWKILPISRYVGKLQEIRYVLYHNLDVVDSKMVFAELVSEQKLDGNLRGWIFQAHS